ncbi:F-box only protein 44-like [Crotalus adamanteus]|uniref:F-box only protein 44-like n=1 Tax=Crotalus adamanteus TaxID=8729 RepID=A0AAW1APV4_CROAD
MSPLGTPASCCCCCPRRRPPPPSRTSSLEGKELTLQELLDVLSWVPKRDLIHHCRLVCKRWRYLVDLPVVWKRKCERLGFPLEQLEGGLLDWRVFFFSLSKRNFLRNVCGRGLSPRKGPLELGDGSRSQPPPETSMQLN